MTGLTDFITEALWRDLLLVWYVLVDDAYQALAAFHGREGRPRRRGPQPTFTDSEVITVALCIDTLFDGHEERGLSFVRQYHHDLFPRLLPNGQFNARRRALTGMIEQIRVYLTHRYDLIDPADEVRLVDSAPLPVCTYARAPRNATLAGAEYYSVMSCRKAKLFGLRLHVVITADQVVDRWGLAPAAPQDAKMLPHLLAEHEDLDVYGDGGYHEPLQERDFAREQNVHVWATPRRDSRTPWPEEFRRLATRLRRRVETALSVLATVFHIEQLGARSLDGLKARVATRLLAYNLCFIVPHFLPEGAA